ncbi:hypothetical protein [Amycolatopsis mediterranei]|uniref:Uncharacterized protein n=1 Tax=Amycolatopsis mediterranei (strain S699) TaxID=713604 RepID=A0A9R0UC75_AMYMS|nr:hypothetical protein [Amycolatopsis mediterranei]AEK45759.1 hypothetical protein RAM_36430 [Amycolatopsis mediterranei S699]UZF73849.1 hypothetical protein ISP_007320 [Amycolatopsis mediterranei]
MTPTPGTKYRIRAELFDYGLSADLAEGTITGRKPLLDFRETDLFTAVDFCLDRP